MKQELTISELIEKGEALHRQRANWHLHLLDPGCRLNQRDCHAVVIEDTDADNVFIAYSPASLRDVAAKLARLVHGDSATQAPPAEGLNTINDPEIRRMVVRAKELMARGIHWHHHIFFPTCLFNPNPGQWTILFEDPESKDTIVSVSTEQPVDAIEFTEQLFYAQQQNFSN